MNENITLAFNKCKKENRPALLTYTVAGDNSKIKSIEILKSISKYIDICEIGFAHNTPIADGGQIQTSTHRALKNGTFKAYKNSKPVILMGYYNIICQYGENKFINSCKKVGVDGLIVVDLPYPENKYFAQKCKKKKISFIQLIAPTTSNKRMQKIIQASHNMRYYISMLSTTGGKLKVSPRKILENYNKIKKINKSKNLVIGFGITTKTISSLKKADGLVVGSALCREISNSLNNRQNPVTNVTDIVKKLKKKIS